MKKSKSYVPLRRGAPAVLAACFVLVAGCASTPEGDNQGSSSGTEGITLELERGPVGLSVREVSEVSSLNVVMMNGLELAQTGPYRFQKREPRAAIGDIARDLGYKIHEAPHYMFLYAPGYEVLRDVVVEDRLDAGIAGLRADVAFGADTPLYSGLALLGLTLEHTIVADNAIAGAVCGEIHLKDVPLAAALEALLQSARVGQDSFYIESTPDYTFLASVNNRRRPQLLTNEASLTEEQRVTLGRRVSVTLPFPQGDPKHLQGHIGASTLGEVLDALSEQLGLQVTSDASMHRLPVNPVVMRKVPIETVLELIIRQWLVPEFGYELDGAGIRLRHVFAP